MARLRRPDLRALGARLSMWAWLTFVWVLLWGTPDVGTIVAGLLVGLAVITLLPLPRVPVEGRLRVLSTARLVITVAFLIVRSSVNVSWLSIRPAAIPRAAVLKAPMRLKSDFTLALAVNTLNIVPGGLVVRVDPIGRFVYIHVLDVSSDGAVDRFYAQTAAIERLYIRAFERPEDWRPSAGHYSAPSEDYHHRTGRTGPDGDEGAAR